MELDAMATSSESRWTFRAYAILALAAGLLLFGWGPLLLGSGQPLYAASLIRVAGGILIAAACFAWSAASLTDPADARRALLGFGTGHLLFFLVLATQQAAIWESPLIDRIMTVVLLTGLIFLYLRYDAVPGPPENAGLTTLSIFGRSRPSVESLRRRYQQQIREAALQEERHRLARDLHDSVKQQIFAIQTSAAAAQARFDADPAGTRAALEQVRSSAREAMAEMEAMLDQLRAAPLENAGLVASLKQQCEALGFRTQAKVDFETGELPESQAIMPGAQEALFRIAQEALSNIARHARAKQVRVALAAVRERFELTVEDDGSGFDPAQPGRGMGIANMRSRAAEFGGTFEIASGPEEGTRLTASIPLQPLHDLAECNRRVAWYAAAVVVHFAIAIWRQSALFATLGVMWVVYLLRAAALRSAAKRGAEGVR
jgi:signal transduction histidine kinase